VVCDRRRFGTPRKPARTVVCAPFRTSTLTLVGHLRRLGLLELVANERELPSVGGVRSDLAGPLFRQVGWARDDGPRRHASRGPFAGPVGHAARGLEPTRRCGARRAGPPPTLSQGVHRCARPCDSGSPRVAAGGGSQEWELLHSTSTSKLHSSKTKFATCMPSSFTDPRCSSGRSSSRSPTKCGHRMLPICSPAILASREGWSWPGRRSSSTGTRC